MLHWYHLVEILLYLGSWSTTIVLGRKWISKEIWGSNKFYVLLCDWNVLVTVCTLFLSLSWHFSCQCGGTNKNGTTTWGLGLEEKLLVRILKHTGESSIVSMRRCPWVCFKLGLKFTSDKENFLIKMCILLSLVLFGPFGRGSKVGNKWNNKSSETIWWAVTRPAPLVWLVLEFNNVCYDSLVHSTISEQFRLHLWGKSEDFTTSTISSWVFTIPWPFVGLYISLIFLILLIMLVIWMVHVNSIKNYFPSCAWGININLGHLW